MSMTLGPAMACRGRRPDALDPVRAGLAAGQDRGIGVHPVPKSDPFEQLGNVVLVILRILAQHAQRQPALQRVGYGFPGQIIGKRNVVVFEKIERCYRVRRDIRNINGANANALFVPITAVLAQL